MPMQTNRANTVLRYIRRLAAAGYALDLADPELLHRFVAERDEAAFTALVRRHGPMVLRLCLRILHNEQDAEDAFQATFLVLSQKAASLLGQGSMSGWLYNVAYRTAQKARIDNARRRKREGGAAVQKVADPLSEITVREAQEILDKELARLPDKFRVPLVLCYLEGLTRDEAAKQLRVPASTLKSRLEQARERLRARLASRGLALAGALVASIFSEGTASASLPSQLLDSTVDAARAAAAGRAAASVVPAHVAALAEGVMKAMFMSKLKIVLAVLLAVVSLGTAARLAQVKAAGPGPDDNAVPRIAAATAAEPTKESPNDVALRQQLQQWTWFVGNADSTASTITVHTQPATRAILYRSVTSAAEPQAEARVKIVTSEDGTRATLANARAQKELEKALALKDAAQVPFGVSLQLGVADGAEVIIDGQQGSLADLQTGMQVSLQMAQERPSITRIEAITPGKVIVKAIDAEKKTITVSVGAQEWTASLAPDAKVRVAGNQEAQLSDLSAEMRVGLRLGVDGDKIVVTSIVASGE